MPSLPNIGNYGSGQTINLAMKNVDCVSLDADLVSLTDLVVNGNVVDLVQMETDITDQGGRLTTAEGEIDTLQTDVTTLQTQTQLLSSTDLQATFNGQLETNGFIYAIGDVTAQGNCLFKGGEGRFYPNTTTNLGTSRIRIYDRNPTGGSYNILNLDNRYMGTSYNCECVIETEKVGVAGDAPLVFKTSSTERLRIGDTTMVSTLPLNITYVRQSAPSVHVRKFGTAWTPAAGSNVPCKFDTLVFSDNEVIGYTAASGIFTNNDTIPRVVQINFHILFNGNSTTQDQRGIYIYSGASNSPALANVGYCNVPSNLTTKTTGLSTSCLIKLAVGGTFLPYLFYSSTATTTINTDSYISVHAL